MVHINFYFLTQPCTAPQRILPLNCYDHVSMDKVLLFARYISKKPSQINIRFIFSNQ